MAASSQSDRGKKLLNHTAFRTRQSNMANPQTYSCKKFDFIHLSLEMWVCGLLLNDVGFCVSQFLNHIETHKPT